MTRRLLTATALLFGAWAPAPAVAQVVIDEGAFEIRVDGRRVGTEEFAIRRGVGRDYTIFATGTVTLSRDGRRQEIKPLLAVTPPDGVASAYKVDVTGPDSLALVLNKVGRRYVANVASAVGTEDREFPARADTRILEAGVAHHYYFIRDVRVGRSIHALEPRTQAQLELLVESQEEEEELRVGPNFVQARKVVFVDGEDRRSVWYDRQGRVLRVEVPSRSWVAERTDVVG